MVSFMIELEKWMVLDRIKPFVNIFGAECLI